MTLVDRHDEKIVYSNCKDFLTEYVLVSGTRGVGVNADCVSYDYIFIVDKRYHRVVGMLEGAKNFYVGSPKWEAMLDSIARQIVTYETEMRKDNKGEFEFESKIAEF